MVLQVFLLCPMLSLNGINECIIKFPYIHINQKQVTGAGKGND